MKEPKLTNSQIDELQMILNAWSKNSALPKQLERIYSKLEKMRPKRKRVHEYERVDRLLLMSRLEYILLSERLSTLRM